MDHDERTWALLVDVDDEHGRAGRNCFVPTDCRTFDQSILHGDVHFAQSARVGGNGEVHGTRLSDRAVEHERTILFELAHGPERHRGAGVRGATKDDTDEQGERCARAELHAEQPAESEERQSGGDGARAAQMQRVARAAVSIDAAARCVTVVHDVRIGVIEADEPEQELHDEDSAAEDGTGHEEELHSEVWGCTRWTRRRRGVDRRRRERRPSYDTIGNSP